MREWTRMAWTSEDHTEPQEELSVVFWSSEKKKKEYFLISLRCFPKHMETRMWKRYLLPFKIAYIGLFFFYKCIYA